MPPKRDRLHALQAVAMSAFQTLIVNDHTHAVDLEPEMPLLWVLRDALNLTGTKFGCGIGVCGACTVEIEGQPTRSCITPLMAVTGRTVRTIEATGDAVLQAVRAAWLTHQVPQCGYCQSAMILSAAALLRQHPQPSEAEVAQAMNVLCRCGTYPRVKQAIASAAAALAAASAQPAASTPS